MAYRRAERGGLQCFHFKIDNYAAIDREIPDVFWRGLLGRIAKR